MNKKVIISLKDIFVMVKSSSISQQKDYTWNKYTQEGTLNDKISDAKRVVIFVSIESQIRLQNRKYEQWKKLTEQTAKNLKV